MKITLISCKKRTFSAFIQKYTVCINISFKCIYVIILNIIKFFSNIHILYNVKIYLQNDIYYTLHLYIDKIFP
jgi:hypothetical protein